MATDILTNQGTGTVTSGGLTAPAGGTSESWTVTAVNAFPQVSPANGTTFKFADPAVTSEIMMATAAPGGTGAGQAWTVTRGAESTVPAVHAGGFSISELITAAVISAKAGSVQALKPGVSPPAIEGWTNVTPPSGWSGVCRYKMLAELSMACVDFQLTHAGATGNVIVIASWPAAYYPATLHDFPLAINSNTAPPNSNQRCTVNPSGNAVTTFALPASTTGIKALLMYPLD